MNEISHDRDLSDVLLEIGERLCPRRYQKFRGLRPWAEACEWARTLEWRDNPYDLFLLRREILRQLENRAIHEPGFRNVYSYASRGEIASEMDKLLNRIPPELQSRGPLFYVTVVLPWHLAFRYGLIRRSPLQAALNQLPVKNRGET